MAFSSPASRGGGNLHPSVANRSPALASALQLSLGSGSPTSGKIAGINGAPTAARGDIDEAEARMRAREILQDFAREKSKAVEVEGQLHRCAQENDKLQHTIAEMKAETAIESDRLKRQLENLKSEKLEAETRAVNAREEAQKVTKVAAQRVSDATSQLRLKEQEIEHLEGELTRARDEIRNLRKELLLSRDQDTVTEDMSRVQYRVVELARKLLDAEKAKTEMQKALVEDRRQLHQSLATIDSLRNQLSDSERRSIDQQAVRDQDIAQFQTTIAALHAEMQQQRDLYQKFVEAVSKSGDSGHRGVSSDEAAQWHTRAAVLETQLTSSQQSARELQALLENERHDLNRCRHELNSERTARIEETTALQARIHIAEERASAAKKESEERRELHQQLNERFISLNALYDSSVQSLSQKNDAIGALERILSELQEQHNVVAAEMEILRGEMGVRDNATAALKEAFKEGALLEQRLREQNLIHQHEKELMRLQFLRNGASALLGPNSPTANGSGLAIELAPHMDMANLQHHVAILEAEKARWQVERSNMMQQSENDRRSLNDELRAAKKAIEDCQLECAQLRSQALHCQREVEEWRLAFHSSERAKHRLEQQLNDVREASTVNQKEKNTSDVQLALLSQHVERLEAQAERDAREIFRLRREGALSEVSIAKQRLNAQLDDIQRVERQEVTDAASALLKERELIQLRMGRQARERELHEKEIVLQKLHESQLLDITKQSRQKASGRHVDPSATVDDIKAQDTSAE